MKAYRKYKIDGYLADRYA